MRFQVVDASDAVGDVAGEAAGDVAGDFASAPGDLSVKMVRLRVHFCVCVLVSQVRALPYR